MAFDDDIMHRIFRDPRKDRGAMLIPGLLALAGGLSGVAALRFLVASAYVALGAVMGYELAALLTGSGLLLLSVGHRGQMAQQDPPDPARKTPGAQERAESDTATQIAFTSAFVLARSLGGDRRG